MNDVDRNWLIDHYMKALDTGNLRQIDEVLQAALHDPELTNMIVEVNRAFEEEKSLTPTPSEQERARQLRDDWLERTTTEYQQINEGCGEDGIPALSGEESPTTSGDFRKQARASPRSEHPGRVPQWRSLIAEGKKKGLNLLALAGQCNVGIALMRMLDRRLIKVPTIPGELIERISKAIGRSREQIIAYLKGDSTLVEGAHHRADQAPQLAAKQDFAEAVRLDTTMTEDQRKYWLEKASQVS